MRVLVACEFSGVVRRAFAAQGHEAWSCDLLPAEDCSAKHYAGDVRAIINRGWDIMIAHPPCQHLSISGARHFHRKEAEQRAALDFICELRDAPIPRIAIENPVSVISTRLGKPTQIIHPWQFGHGETKKTCLWLYWLPPLQPTAIVSGRHPRVAMMPETKHRARERARTYEGIAAAMAQQWGSLRFD